MKVSRLVVDDVDAEIAAFEVAGYQVAQRWGPPFAILSNPDREHDAELWISGPGSSAAQSTAAVAPELQAAASQRLVHQTDDLSETLAQWRSAGWQAAGEEVSGPGGTQILLRRGPVFVELFAAD